MESTEMEKSPNSDTPPAPGSVTLPSQDSEGLAADAGPSSLLDPRLYDGLTDQERVERKIDYLLSFVETMANAVNPLIEGITTDPLGTLAGLMLQSDGSEDGDSPQ